VIRSGFIVTFVAPSRLAREVLKVEYVDVAGRVSRRMLLGSVPPGGVSARWDLRTDNGSAVSAGVYFMRAQLGPEQLTRRLIVLR
jgi:flagellar hook assembly protein FlgD